MNKRTDFHKLEKSVVTLKGAIDFYLDSIINDMGLRYVDHHQRFYWPTGSELTDLKVDYYRTNEIAKRDMQDIAPEELMLAIAEAANHNLSIEEADLMRYVARGLGMQK